MTHAEIADASGLAESFVQRVERGEANPRLVTLSKIAYALGVPLSELLRDNLRPRSAAAARGAC